MCEDVPAIQGIDEMDYSDGETSHIHEKENEMEKEGKSQAGSVIRTLCLVAITMCVLYFAVNNYLEKQEIKIAKASVLSGAAKEISLAKNTLYESGIVSTMIKHIDKSSTWEFFESNTGQYVVQVSGTIADVDKFIKAMGSSRVSAYLRSDIRNIKSSKTMRSIGFRIQFVKELGATHDTPYNNYTLGYSEYAVVDSSGMGTYVGYGDEMLDIFEAYLQDTTL